jgi:putative endonuclease
MVRPSESEGVEQMIYVYILKSEKDNNLYIGFSKDLKSRVEAHNLGLNASTSCRKPLRLIYYEGYTDEKDARKREKFLKSGRGHEVIYKQLENTLKI